MIDPIRQDFEQAVRADMGYPDQAFTRMKNGEYKNLRVQFLWQGWRLAQEHAGKTTAAPVDEPAEREDPLL